MRSADEAIDDAVEQLEAGNADIARRYFQEAVENSGGRLSQRLQARYRTALGMAPTTDRTITT